MSNYRDDGAATRERARMLEQELDAAKSALSKREAELDAQDDELAQLKARIDKLEKSRPAPRKERDSVPGGQLIDLRALASSSSPVAPSNTMTRRAALGWLSLALVVFAVGAGGIGFLSGPNPGRVRVSVGNRDIEQATFIVEGPNADGERCTAKTCDFKLPPGRYHIVAESGEYRGSTDVVVRSSHSLGKSITLTK